MSLDSSGSPAALWSKTGQVLLYVGLGALLLQLQPSLEELRWLPEDPQELLPRLFRSEEPSEEILGEVNDEVLISLGAPSLGGVLEPRPQLAEEQPIEDDQEFLIEGMVVESGRALPPHPKLRRMTGGLPLMEIEDPQQNMRRFYSGLRRLEIEEAQHKVRILHYGDSLITGDLLSRTVRRLLQKKFGDGGHGFVLAGRPSPWYGRDQLRLSNSKEWKINRLTRPWTADRSYGLGGACFSSRQRGQWVRMQPKGKEGLGELVSQITVHYMADPRGGRFQISLGHSRVEVNTRAEKGARVAEIRTSEGRHKLRIKTLGGGKVRLFGVALERDSGVVYDSLGIDGTRAKLLRKMNPEHWHKQLRQRRPDLLILNYGTNESESRSLNLDRYRDDLAYTLGHLRAALPGISCLIVAPMDRAKRSKKSGRLATMPIIKRILRVQREVAYAQGCAFWNTWRAMGGEGSMARWYRARPPLGAGDLTHPTGRGGDRLGAMLFAALMEGYRGFSLEAAKR